MNTEYVRKEEEEEEEEKEEERRKEEEGAGDAQEKQEPHTKDVGEKTNSYFGAARYPYPGPTLDPICTGVQPPPQFPSPQSFLGEHG